MSKWTKKDPTRTYISDAEAEEKRQRKSRMLSQALAFIKRGAEAEQEVIEAAKIANPDITQEEVDELVKQFHAAVWDYSWRD